MGRPASHQGLGLLEPSSALREERTRAAAGAVHPLYTPYNLYCFGTLNLWDGSLKPQTFFEVWEEQFRRPQPPKHEAGLRGLGLGLLEPSSALREERTRAAAGAVHPLYTPYNLNLF